MWAMAKASSAPTKVPNASAHGRLVTLRAKAPMIAPATRPLIVDPMTMPIICGRASGVNQAVDDAERAANQDSHCARALSGIGAAHGRDRGMPRRRKGADHGVVHPFMIRQKTVWTPRRPFGAPAEPCEVRS